MKCSIFIFLHSLVFAIYAHAVPTSLSFAPVLDYSVLDEPSDTVILRNAIIAELTEAYDCAVLCRSNGVAILEEQRRLAYASSQPVDYPYPPAADYLLIVECLKETEAVRLRVSYTGIDGEKKSKLKSFSIPFESSQLLKSLGADQVVKQLAERMNLTSRPVSSKQEASSRDFVWAVLPFQNLSTSTELAVIPSMQSMSSKILTNIVGGQIVDDAFIADATATIFKGASENLIGTIGRSIGADFVVTGTIKQTNQNLTTQLFIIRSRDALIVAAREFLIEDISDLERYMEASLASMVAQKKTADPLPDSTAAANLEEAKILYRIADEILTQDARKVWNKNQALALYLAVAMVAQDTSFEEQALARIPIILHLHPNWFYFRKNWRTNNLNESQERFNLDVLLTLERALEGLPSISSEKILLKSYMNIGRWNEAYILANRLIEANALDPSERDTSAADYIRLLSLTERNIMATEFFDSLDNEEVGNFTLIQAAHHFRRIGDERRELATYEEHIESGKWRSWINFSRLCQLLSEHRPAERQIELLNQLKRSFRQIPMIQWQLVQAELATGKTQKAQERAAILLQRKNPGKCGFPSEADFKARLQSIAGQPRSRWPTADEIRSIPDDYRMYIQPVGEVDHRLVEDAAAIASDFFGVSCVVRPSIPAPESRTVFMTDLLQYLDVPLLRFLITARPPPEDAINQLFIVDRKFLVHGRGEVTDVYRYGLGTMISSSIVQKNIPANKQATRLATMIIRQFRYYVERSQGISLEQSPNNNPCVNTHQESTQQPKLGYCPECVQNYESADWEIVYNFVQALPLDLAFEPDYIAWPRPITKEESDSIQQYAENLESL